MTDHANTGTTVVLWCAHAAGRTLDRRVCAPPCEALHLRCDACGAALGDCPFESPAHHERLIRRIGALVGDEAETLLVVAIVERAGHSAFPVTWDAARSVARGGTDHATSPA